MRDGIKGWKDANYPIESQQELIDALIAVNKIDYGTLMVSEEDARKLKNSTFVDFRSETKYNKGHVDGANFVDYANMFTRPPMEELNKDNSLVIIHDVPATAAVIAATLKMMNYPDVYILK